MALHRPRTLPPSPVEMLNPYRCDELWTTIAVTKEFSFGISLQGNTPYLDVEDVKEYLAKDAVLCAGRAPSPIEIQSLIQNALTALGHCFQGSVISVSDYNRFVDHMKTKHSSSIGSGLALSLPKTDFGSSITLKICFKVPYQARYGLVNVEYLRNLAAASSGSDIFQPLLEHCCEVRGFREAQGVYVAASHFSYIAEALQLRFDSKQIHEIRDTSLDKFTYQSWYLLAPNESSEIFPVNRTTGGVHRGNSVLPLHRFLEEYFPKGTYLDSQTVHNPEQLIAPQAMEQVPYSCEGSVGPCSSDPLAFRKIKSVGAEAVAKKRQLSMTGTWVKEQLSTKRLRTSHTSSL